MVFFWSGEKIYKAAKCWQLIRRIAFLLAFFAILEMFILWVCATVEAENIFLYRDSLSCWIWNFCLASNTSKHQTQNCFLCMLLLGGWQEANKNKVLNRKLEKSQDCFQTCSVLLFVKQDKEIDTIQWEWFTKYLHIKNHSMSIKSPIKLWSGLGRLLIAATRQNSQRGTDVCVCVCEATCCGTEAGVITESHITA